MIEAGELPDFLAMKQADAEYHVRTSSSVGRLLAEGPPWRVESIGAQTVLYYWPTAAATMHETEHWMAGPTVHPFQPYMRSHVCSAWVGTLYAGRPCGKSASEHETLTTAPNASGGKS